MWVGTVVPLSAWEGPTTMAFRLAVARVSGPRLERPAGGTAWFVPTRKPPE